MSLTELGKRTKTASQALRSAGTEQKRKVLSDLADRLVQAKPEIRQANLRDLEQAKSKGLSTAMIDRLRLDDTRVEAMAASVREVSALEDVVGQTSEEYSRPNGLRVQRKRIPLGMIGVIYESRPNVTIEAASLCFYAGNGLLLRGGSEAFHSNQVLVKIMKEALAEEGYQETINIVPTTDRSSVDEMARMNDVLDVLIPRGGEGLIRHIYDVATVPVIAHYKGNCHMFVDESADLDLAIRVSVNAKTQRPGVCNALETLLVHQELADKFLPPFLEEMKARGVEIRGCPETQRYSEAVLQVTEEDYDTEFLDLILAVRVVTDLEQAIEHIQTYTSDHTEAIISTSREHIDKFTRALDSSAIMVNTSTRFNDGGQLGLGAEIGISTTKLHSFGPMGLRELTTTKFVVTGTGQVRS